MYKYQEGNEYKWSVEEILDSLYTYYYDMIEESPSTKSDFFFALALALWEINELNPKLLSVVKHIIDERIDYNAWRDLEADEKTLKQRLTATQAFYQKLLTSNSKPKSRQLPDVKLSSFVLGDCLTILYRGKYYGLVVLDDGRNVDDGSNHFTFVDIAKETLPTLDDFYNASLILNEGMVNFISNIATTEMANPPVVFTFKLSKAAAEKAKNDFTLVGNMPFTRTHFERSSVRVTDSSAKVPSFKKLVATAIDYWSEHPWKVSNYVLSSRSNVPDYFVDRKQIRFGIHALKLEDIVVKVENSLWHIEVWIHAKKLAIGELEDNWLVFADYIGKQTGREINTFSIAEEEEVGSDFLPLNKIDFNKYKLRHVKDFKIV